MLPVVAPVLILAFNRPDSTRVVLDRVLRAGVDRLYVHCDGPRPDKAGEAEQVAAVRALFESLPDGVVVHRLFRTHNMGLRDGVSGAISWFLEQEPSGIILEDDCVPDPTFFPFCTELLHRYAADERILQIAGSNLAEPYTRHLTDSYVFSRFALIWGWATWRRAWQKMDVNLTSLETLESSGVLAQLVSDQQAQVYMLDKLWVTKRRENHSWAYAWSYSVLQNKGLCIIPHVNLIENVGIGTETATHTTTRNVTAQRRARAIGLPLRHPLAVGQPDPALEQQFFYVSQKSKIRLWLWTVLRWLKRLTQSS